MLGLAGKQTRDLRSKAPAEGLAVDSQALSEPRVSQILPIIKIYEG
jgi:hypothetical protein